MPFNPRFFSVVPNPELLPSIQRHYTEMAVSRLSAYITFASQHLSQDAGKVLRKLDETRSEGRLSHTLFCASYEMDLAIHTNQWEPLRGLLASLNNLATVRAPEREIEVCSVETKGYDAKLLKQCTFLGPWGEAGEVRKEQQPQPISKKEVSAAKKIIPKVLDEAKVILPSYLEEVDAYVTSIRLYRQTTLLAFSDDRIFGALYVRLPTEKEKAYYLEHILHETAHLHLCVLMSLDPILLNDPNDRYPTPKRSEPRPMLGLLHQMFVIWRIENALKRALEAGLAYEGLEQIYLEHKQMLDTGLPILEKHAKVTPMGQMLLKSMGVEVDLSQELTRKAG